MKRKLTPTLNPEIVSFCNGDNDAIAGIYLQWTPEFFFVAFRYLKNRQDAEDVVAHLFEKLLNMPLERRKKQLIDEGIDLKALLLVVLKNKCFDKLKVDNNRKRILNNIKNTFAFISYNNVWKKYSNETVETIISVLPEQERKIFKMKLDGFDRSEISKNMNLSLKSVSNSLSKSRSILKELIVDFE